ncbi:MAG: ABC transporter substrate-binding protein [Proteobacteria bacterium]|nr:ABC transporter substrate-binding protein [Pseudomonadota bacterium]
MLKTSWCKRLLVPLMVAALCLCLGGSVALAAKWIKVGGILDTTGATSDVGRDYALGVQEAIAYVNDHGGIDGKGKVKIKLIWEDYAYRIPQAITLYKRLKRIERVVAILGWGTGDTEALSKRVGRDQMPYVSASYSAHLTDPRKTPYNLFFATDYSTNARAAMIAWYYKVWKPRGLKRKPRFICFYATNSAYARAPIKALKDQAKILGFEVGKDQHVSLTATDCKGQVLAALKFKPDLVWHGNTTGSVAAALRSAYVLKLGAGHIVNNWGYDENLPKLAGRAAEGAVGPAPCAFFMGKGKLMDQVHKYARKLHPNVPFKDRLIRTVQAWGDVIVLWEAMKRAYKATGGRLTGKAILKKGFETMRNWPIGLGANPVTYTATDHRAASAVNVYQIKNGKFVRIMNVNLKKMYPKKWASEWLGW